MNQIIIDAMTNLDEDILFDEVNKSVEKGVASAEILADLQLGLTKVGELFEKKEYFLSELIMSADLFNQVSTLFGDDDTADSSNYIGTFLIGTVETDVHDIGKNIVVSVMKSNGFKVIDIGVDVPVKDFVEAVRKYDPQIIGMSCLLTTAFDAMKKTIAALREENLIQGKLVLIGGGPVDDNTAVYVGADSRCPSAQDAVIKSKEFLGEKVI